MSTLREAAEKALVALEYMHTEKVDYMIRNNLGDPLREDAARLAVPAIEALRAELAKPDAPMVQDGWQLVPVEPTEAMWSAGRDPVMFRELKHYRPASLPVPAWQRNPDGTVEKDTSKGTTAVHVWRAMLAAAPGAPTARPALECERCGLAPKEHGATHWCDNQSFRPAPTSATVSEPAPLTSDAMKPGGRYNWKGQPDRLIFVRRFNGWHQFKKIGDSRPVWCEVLGADLHMLEETRAAQQEQAIEHCLWARNGHARCPQQERKSLTDAEKRKMWLDATIELCSHENCYQRGIVDAERAHGITATKGDSHA